MATNKGYTQADYVKAYERLGSERRVASELGVAHSTVHQALKRANRDPAMNRAAGAIGTEMEPLMAWFKTKPDEDGTSYSVLLKRPAEDRNFLEEMRRVFDGLNPAEPIEPPEHVLDDLCTVYPLMDVHLGMLADPDETGGSAYNTKRAVEDLKKAFAKVLALTPYSADAVLIIGGDFFHGNDHTNQTQKSRHTLDVDGRHWKVVGAGIEIISEIVGTLAMRHQNLTIRVLRGNHDPESHMALTFALYERYRDVPHITVDKSPMDIFMKQWGKCLIAAHHGDRAPPERLSLYISDICPYWSDTRHRHVLTGHVHKDQAKDVGPIRWESLYAFAPPDAYAAGSKYSGRRSLQAMTFHKEDGRVLVASDPID